jgi:hypothetical protein
MVAAYSGCSTYAGRGRGRSHVAAGGAVVAVAATACQPQTHDAGESSTYATFHYGTALHTGGQNLVEGGVFSVVDYRLVVGIQIVGIKVVLSHVFASLKEQRVDVVERPVSAGNVTVSGR